MPRGRGNILASLTLDATRARSTLSQLASDTSDMFSNAFEGGFAARLGALMAVAANEFVSQVLSQIDEAAGVERSLAQARGEIESDELLNEALANALRRGIDPDAAVRGISELRRFPQFEGDREATLLASQAASRLEQVGVDTESFNRLVRRSGGTDIGAGEYDALAQLFYSIPTSTGADPAAIFNQVEQNYELFQSLGITSLPEQLQFASQADLAGFQVSDFNVPFGHLISGAAEAGIPIPQFAQGVQQAVQQAGTAEEALAIGDAFYRTPLNPGAGQRLTQFFRQGGTFQPQIPASILDEPGLAAVFGTEAERRAGQAQGEVIDPDSYPGAQFDAAVYAAARELWLVGDLVQLGERGLTSELPPGVQNARIGNQPVVVNLVLNSTGPDALSPDVVEQINRLIAESRRGSQAGAPRGIPLTR